MEELVGLRAWRARDGILWSLYRPVAWVPGHPVRATCMSAQPETFVMVRPAAHRAPSRGCRCGLYARRRATEDSNRCSGTGEEIAALLGLPSASEERFVLGEVSGWGTAEIATEGWRAEWCRVRAIYDTHPEAGALAELYDVPLVSP